MFSKQSRESALGLNQILEKNQPLRPLTGTQQPQFERYIAHFNTLQRDPNIYMTVALMQSIHMQHDRLIKSAENLFPSSTLPPFSQLQIKKRELDSKCQEISLKNLSLFARILNIREQVVSSLISQGQCYPGRKKELAIITSKIHELRDYIKNRTEKYFASKNSQKPDARKDLGDSDIDQLLALTRRMQILHLQCSSLKNQLLLMHGILTTLKSP